MGCILQYMHQLEMRSNKWVASGGRWEVGGLQALKISACIWQVSIGLYQRQNKGKSSGLNWEN